jgi:hypothetical protein
MRLLLSCLQLPPAKLTEEAAEAALATTGTGRALDSGRLDDRPAVAAPHAEVA